MLYHKITLILLSFCLIFCSPKKEELSRENYKTGSDLIFKDGDIIFQTSTSGQSKAIQLATNSKYSHMGIIFQKNGAYFVYEAVQPVSFKPLKEWIERGENDHFVVKRLKNADSILTDRTLAKMQETGKKFYGKNYDLYFEWSDKNIYCSELVWKIYKEGANVEIGKLQPLKTFNLKIPDVHKKMKERYGNNIPLNEKVISPVAMFQSNLLVTVAKK